MDYLIDPIPVELFNRLFRKERGFGADMTFLGFTQTEKNWTATYQDEDMIVSFNGRVHVTKGWIIEALKQEEAHP